MNGEGNSSGSAPGNRRRMRRAAAGQGAGEIPGGDGSPAPAASWQKAEKDKLGAEQDYRVRAGESEAVARLNGHGQWIEAEGRRLLDWLPLEVFQ
jgi:hypothetical protein